MTSALIGNTGFVGTNLARQFPFDDVYNSSNIGEIAGKSYDLVVSAGTRADSHWVNRHPDQDRAAVEALAESLSAVTIDKLVLISTVCVYPALPRGDEDTVVDTARLTPYGRHRRWLEDVLAAVHNTVSVRLPQLFGRGIKKGLIFDLLHRRGLEHIDPDDAFQYYDLNWLWRDICTSLSHGLRRVNLATPPIAHRRVADLFGIELDHRHRPTASRDQFSRMYTRNMVTRYADLFGSKGDYVVTLEQEIDAIRAFRDEVGAAELSPSMIGRSA